MDEPTAWTGGGAGPGLSREAYDIPEWVSEVRRLYVEPKTRAKMREEGAGARHRRLPGIRPSRRTAAPPSPPTPSPSSSSPSAPTPSDVEPASTTVGPAVAASSDASGHPVGLPLTPAMPLPPIPATAVPPAAQAASAATPDPAPAPGSPRPVPATDHAPAASEPAPAQAPSDNGSGPSTVSQPWIPPTWASSRGAATTEPVAHHASPQVPTATDDGPVDVPGAGSALARFALDADTAAQHAAAGPSRAPFEAEAQPKHEPEPKAGAEPQPQAEPQAEPDLPQTLTMPAVPAVPVGVGVAPVPAPTEGAAPAEPPPDLRGAGPGRPHTVPAVHLSWREADSLDLGVPSVDDSSDAIVLEPPSQLVADTRRRSPQRRRAEAAEEAIWTPVDEGGSPGTPHAAASTPSGDIPAAPPGDGPAAPARGAPAAATEHAPTGDDTGMSATRSAARAAARGSSPGRTLSRPVLIAIAVALLLVLLVVGWLVLGRDGSDGAAGSGVVVSTTGASAAPAAHPFAMAP